jgi:hypothetical protein
MGPHQLAILTPDGVCIKCRVWLSIRNNATLVMEINLMPGVAPGLS